MKKNYKIALFISIGLVTNLHGMNISKTTSNNTDLINLPQFKKAIETHNVPLLNSIINKEYPSLAAKKQIPFDILRQKVENCHIECYDHKINISQAPIGGIGLASIIGLLATYGLTSFLNPKQDSYAKTVPLVLGTAILGGASITGLGFSGMSFLTVLIGGEYLIIPRWSPKPEAAKMQNFVKKLHKEYSAPN